MELPSKYMLTVAKSLLGFGSGEPLPYQKSRGRDRLQEVALQDFLQDGKELKVLSTSSSMSKREGDSQPKTTCSKAKSEEDVRQENEQWELLHGPDSPDADEEGLEMLLGQPSLPPWHAVAAFCTCYAAQLLSSSPSKAAASVAGAAATAAAGSTGLQELVDLWRSGVWPCLVLDALLPGTLDERAINIAEPTPEPSDRVEASLPSTPFHHSTQGNSQRPQQQQQQQQQQWARLSLEEQCENWELCVSSARAFGCCNVTGVTAVDIAEGKVEVLLQCVMDILKAATLQVLSLHRPSGLTALQKPQENELDFSLQGPESLVHRWTHHHLAQAAQWRSSPQGLPTYGYQERVQSEGKGTYGDGDAVVSVSKDDRGGHGAGVGRGARKDNGGGAREESGKGAGDTGQAGCVAGEEDGLGHKKRRVAEVGVVEVAAVLQELLAWRQHQREYRQQQQQQQQQQELLQRAGKQQGEEHAQGTLPHMGQEQEREAHWGKQKQAEGQQQEELPGSPQLEGQEHDGAAQGPPLPTDTAATYATPYAAAHAAAHALLRAPPHKACVAAAHALAHAVQALELGVPMEPAWAQVVPPQLLQIVLAAAMRVCPALIDPTQLPEPDSSFHSEGVCSSGSSTPKSSSSDRSSGTQAVRGDTRDSLCSPASAANSGEEKEEAGRLKRVAEQKREAGRVVGPESGQGSEKQGPGFSVRLRHVESRSGRIEDGGASSNISDQSVLLQKSRDLKACPTPPHRHRSSPPQQHTTQRMYQLTDDEGAFDKNEERLLRAWLNQLVGPKLGCHLQTLFDPVMLTGYPLLLGCEAIQPGCVQWRQAFVPPFSARSRVPFKIMCTENGNQVCAICTRLWKLPIVNIGGVDVAEGHRSALLSLAWQVQLW